MSLLAANYLFNESQTKFVSAAIGRTDTSLKPEVHIGKHKEEKVILSHDNWKEFELHFAPFSQFFDGKIKNYQIQLVAENHLTYIYTRSQFGKLTICISQIRRNNIDKPRFPAAFYFSAASWDSFLRVTALINTHLQYIKVVTPIVRTKIIPALSRAVFRLGGITKEATDNICSRVDNFILSEFHCDELLPSENNRTLLELLMFNRDLLWEHIFEIEMALA